MAYHEHYGSCGECGIELSDPANVDVSELAKLLTTNAALTAKLAVATEALKIRHQWKARNMGYQYSRFVCTVCEMKSDIDETETLCGVGAQRFLAKIQEVE